MRSKRLHGNWREDRNGGFHAWISDPFGRVWQSKRHASAEGARYEVECLVAEDIATITIQWREVKLPKSS